MALGFTGSCNRVAAFARDWRVKRPCEHQATGRGAFAPLPFRTGEAFRFGWSEDRAFLGGGHTKLQAAHIKPSHSRAFLARAYPYSLSPSSFRTASKTVSKAPR